MIYIHRVGRDDRSRRSHNQDTKERPDVGHNRPDHLV